MAVLESIGAAMPGVGFAVGGLLAALGTPRTTFVVAGVGVLAILLVMAPLLGVNWLERAESPGSTVLDGGNDVVLELLPGSHAVQTDPEVEP
jgi:hypothetical protein